MRQALAKIDDEDAAAAERARAAAAQEMAEQARLREQRAAGDPIAPMPAPAVAVPAGWYPHPSMADTRRYWDGQRWTDHIAPADSTTWPYSTEPGATGSSNVLSIIGIVMGGIAFLFCPILFGPAGLILGGIAMARKERLAVVALIVSGCGMVVGFVLGFLVWSASTPY